MISPMMSVTRFTALTISAMVSPAWSTMSLPLVMLSTELEISFLISLAAADDRWASERTSPATTANPRPCSPARAASTAAFSARMLVWKAMPSMTLMISLISRELLVISPIRTTTCLTTSPPRLAVSLAPTAS